MKNKTEISVVIPAYNEEKNIGECLSSLLKQSFKDFEIIVVDDGSQDKTKEIVKKYQKNNKNISLIQGEHKGPGASRNLGASRAKGKILAFVDADMVFDKDYLHYLTYSIRKGKSVGTEERHQKASNLDNVWSRCWGAYVTGDRKNSEMKGIVFRAILKKNFMKMGGFDSKFGYADDLTFFFKYDVKPDLADKAVCYHKNPSSLKEVYGQSKWIGSSRAVYHPYLGNKLMLPFIFILGIIAVIPLTLFLFFKKIMTGKFIPKSIKETGILALFSFVRVWGTFIGILRRNIKGINYR